MFRRDEAGILNPSDREWGGGGWVIIAGGNRACRGWNSFLGNYYYTGVCWIIGNRIILVGYGRGVVLS